MGQNLKGGISAGVDFTERKKEGEKTKPWYKKLFPVQGTLSAPTAVVDSEWNTNVSRYQRKLKNGWEFLSTGKLSLALKSFNEAIEKDSTVPECFYSRGRCYEELENYDKAIFDYSHGIRLIKNVETSANSSSDKIGDLQVLCFVHRGRSKYHLGIYEGSLKDFSRAIELNPEFKLAYWNLGDTYLKMNNFDGVYKNYSKVIEMNPKDALSYFRRGMLLKRFKNYEKALEDFDRAVELTKSKKKKIPRTYCYQRGLVKLELKRYESALEDFDLEKITYSNRSTGPSGNALVFLRQGRYEDAIGIYNETIRKFPEEGFLYNYRGECFLKIKKIEEAKNDFLKAIELDPSDSYSYSNLGEVFYDLNDFRQSEEYFKRATDTGKNLSHVYERCFEIHKKHDYTRALEDYCRVVTLERSFTFQSDLDQREVKFEWEREDIQELCEKMKKELTEVDRWYPFSKDTKSDEETEIKENNELSEKLKGIGIDNFKVFRCIGRGAFGSTYLCRILGVRGIFVMKLFFDSLDPSKSLGELDGRSEIEKQTEKPSSLLKSKIVSYDWKKTRQKEDVRIPYHRNVVSVLYSSERPELVNVRKFPDYNKFWRRKLRSRNSKLKKMGVTVEHPCSFESGIIVMRYHRKDLMKYCQQRKRSEFPFENTELCYMLKSLLSGILHLHKNKIVHRDLHLGNIFCDEAFGRIFIGDFGCALDLRDNKTGFKVPSNHEILFTCANTGVKTSKSENEEESEGEEAVVEVNVRKGGYPLHLAPEIIDFDFSKCNQEKTSEGEEGDTEMFLDYEKSDVFSVGMIGYKLMTLNIGRNETGAFGNNFHPVFGKKKKLKDRSMDDLQIEGAKCHEKIISFVLKLLEVDFEKRMNIEEALDEIEDLEKFFWKR